MPSFGWEQEQWEQACCGNLYGWERFLTAALETWKEGQEVREAAAESSMLPDKSSPFMLQQIHNQAVPF